MNWESLKYVNIWGYFLNILTRRKHKLGSQLINHKASKHCGVKYDGAKMGR